MKINRKYAEWAGELFLTLEVILYWIFSSPLNPIAACLLLVLVSQYIFRNDTIGSIVSTIFFILNGYMFLALYSEYKDIEQWTTLSIFTFSFITLMLTLGICASIMMLLKWIARLPASSPSADSSKIRH